MESPLKTERKRRGWSQQFVGDKVGLSAPQISRIEANGVESPYLGKILNLVKLFGFSLSLEQICQGPTEKREEDSEAA
jgi:transcriptional regulator with XRE-family HTH domain